MQGQRGRSNRYGDGLGAIIHWSAAFGGGKITSLPYDIHVLYYALCCYSYATIYFEINVLNHEFAGKNMDEIRNTQQNDNHVE